MSARTPLGLLRRRPSRAGCVRENQKKPKSPGGLCGGRGSETTAGAKIEFSANTPCSSEHGTTRKCRSNQKPSYQKSGETASQI